VRIGIAAALIAVACAGCSVAPSPAWQADAHDALASFTETYLKGDTKLATRYFAESRAAVAGTGRPDLVARMELIRCGIGTAALDFDACSGYEAIQSDATTSDRAYADFLAGKFEQKGGARLPPQYEGVARAKDADSQNLALQEIKDPLSRLVAAGALFRGGRLSPEGIATAVDTASEQAWRHPLLAYLNVQAKLAETAGDAPALDSIRKRIELVSKAPAR
jgi:hypothetical protein